MKRLAFLAALLAAPALAQQSTGLDPSGSSFGSQQVAPVKAMHGNWEVRCVAEADCFMTQLHRRTEGTADAIFTIAKRGDLPSGDGQQFEAFAEIVVPLGIYLPGGLGLKVDDQPAKAAPFERCIEEGCIVRAPVSSTMLNNLKAGSTVSIVVFAGPERPIRIPLSLIGFTAAYGAL